MPAAAGADDDAQRRKDRAERKVTAILHDSYPIRYWDHDLGPECARLLIADPPEVADDAAGLELRDLTGHVGQAIGPDSSWDLSPDGRLVVAAWSVPEPAGSQRYTLVAIDVATGTRHTLLDDPDREYGSPAISPDGGRVAVVEYRRSSATLPLDARLLVLDLATGEAAEVAQGWDRWPAGRPAWTPDGSSLLVVADEAGRAPVFLIDVGNEVSKDGLDGDRSAAGGAPRRLTGDHGAYSDVVAGPDGRT